MESGLGRAVRTITGNISTGGLYFEMDLLDEDMPTPQLHSMLNIDLTVPPGDGYFPYEGRVRAAAEVVRCDPARPAASRHTETPTRLGIGARFRDPLKLVF